MEKKLDLEEICFRMITAAGEAKSDYLEALESARENRHGDADRLMRQGDKSLAGAHESHAELVRLESSGKPVKMTLLLCHVEDQIMSSEVIRLMAAELCELYRSRNMREAENETV